VHDGDVVGGQLLHHAGLLGDDDVTGVDRGAVLHAGADERRLAAQQRDGLAHHVGPHERAVGVVVLEERDHRGRDRADLARRDVDVVDAGRVDVVDLAALLADRARGRPANEPDASSALACAMTCLSSSSAVR
jgi:hypothetical protein